MNSIIVFLLAVLCPLTALSDELVPSEAMEKLFMDDSVYTPTRFRNPAGHVADNVTVVTAEDIADMQARSVAEILENVNGMLISWSKDVLAPSLLHVQGSETYHVAVKLDGVPINFLSSGDAEINTIPVNIIEKIEIIKGPASAAWGSALGGVINIITKGWEGPRATLNAAYGERNTTSSGVQVSGLKDNLGYYAYAGTQHSKGLVSSRGGNSSEGFAKLLYIIDYGLNLEVAMGVSDPETDLGPYPDYGILSSSFENPTSFISTKFETPVSKRFSFNISAFHTKREPILEHKSLENEGLFQKSEYKERSTGILSQLLWRYRRHSVVLGFDYFHNKLDQDIYSGLEWQLDGAPAELNTSPDKTEWALYTNGTFVFGKWAFSPGVRFDHNDITGSFISPTVGATYRFEDKRTLLRASISRGFADPGLSLLEGGALFLDPNPDLDPETVWSYQAGIETSAIKYIRLKSTLFYHDSRDVHDRSLYASAPPTYNDQYINNGRVTRKGAEIEVETLPFNSVSFSASISHTDINYHETNENGYVTTGNVKIKYHNPKVAKVLFYGQLNHWSHPTYSSKNEVPIWNLTINKEFPISKNLKAFVFCKGYNLFNGRCAAQNEDINPKRWFETGIKLEF